MNDLAPFKFQGLEFEETYWIGRTPHATCRAIGVFLEYRNPQKAIDKIIERNPYIKQFSVTVKLGATDGKEYDTELYNPIGIQLIMMESHQPKAISYKIAAAHLIEAVWRGTLKPCRPTHQRFFVAMKGFEDAEKTAHGHRMESWEKAAFESGRSIQTLYRWRKRFKERGTLCYDSKYKNVN